MRIGILEPTRGSPGLQDPGPFVAWTATIEPTGTCSRRVLERADPGSRLAPGRIATRITLARTRETVIPQALAQVLRAQLAGGSPHPLVYTDRVLRPGDPAFFDILHSFNGYRTCYYRTFAVGSVSPAMVDAYKRSRDYMDAAISIVKPGVTTADVVKLWPKAQEFGFPNEEAAFALTIRARRWPIDMGENDL